MQAYISPVLGGALLAMPIGIVVGVFSRRALKRKLGGQLSDGDTDHSARSATRPSNMSRLSQGGKVTADKMIVFPSRIFLNRLTEQAQEYGFRLGLAIVCGLMIFATYKDIAHITRQLMHWG